MKRLSRGNKRSAITSYALLCGAVCAWGTTTAEQNWPQWRGPLQTGAAPSADPPTTWSETSNIKWKVKVPGEGSATPLVWDNLIFVQAAVSTGKKAEPKPADTSQTASSGRTEASAAPSGGPGEGAGGPNGRPEGGPPRDMGGPGGGGPGGGMGGGGMGPGPGAMLGGRMISEGDKDKDSKLSKDEFTGLADAWFDKLDTEKTGKLDQEKFVSSFGNIMGPPPEGGPGGGRGPGRFMAQGLFNAVDSARNGTVTREQFHGAFEKWFAAWDTDKSGALDAAKLREGLNTALPRPQFGGQGGRRGGRGGMGGMKPTEVMQFTVLCLDRGTGKVLWQQVAREELPHEGIRDGEGSFAAPSGVTDGKHVFAYFGSRGLYCYDLKGKQEWSKDLGKMRVAMGFGEGSSPALYKDTLIVNWDNEDGSYIIALDKNTGNTLWKQTREEGTSWATPIIVESDGKAQVVTSATRKIRSYDLATGKQVWEATGLTRNVIPSPVAGNDGMVYCISGFGGSALLAIKLGHEGDLMGTDAIAWTYRKSTPYVPSPLLYEGKLYFNAVNNGVISCLDAKTGHVLTDAERVEALNGVYSSPVGAGGKVYLAGRNGATVVLKQSDKFEVLATNRLSDRFDASPAAVGKELLLRGHDYLYCIAEK